MPLQKKEVVTYNACGKQSNISFAKESKSESKTKCDLRNFRFSTDTKL
jgi:hypothetical protein